MKGLSLNKKRILILLTPFSYIIFACIGAFLMYLDPSTNGLGFIGYLVLIVGRFVSMGAYYVLMFNLWECPHCHKHLAHILALLFIGWFWVLVTSPKECPHCGKEIDYRKSYPQPKNKKIPEWAQQLEDKKTKDQSEYFRH